MRTALMISPVPDPWATDPLRDHLFTLSSGKQRPPHATLVVLSVFPYLRHQKCLPDVIADEIVAMLFLVICLAHAGDVLLNQKPLAWPLMTSVPGLIVVVSVLLPPALSQVRRGLLEETQHTGHALSSGINRGPGMPACSFDDVAKTPKDTSHPWPFPILSACPYLSSRKQT